MNNRNKGLKKTLLLGMLTLAISIPMGMGAASAASFNGTMGNRITLEQLSAQYGIDLNSLLQQIMQGNYPVGSNPYVPAPKPVKPSKPHLRYGSGNTGNT